MRYDPWKYMHDRDYSVAYERAQRRNALILIAIAFALGFGVVFVL